MIFRYDGKAKWKQACLSVLGEKFVRSHLPTATWQPNILEPPFMLRREAFKVKQQVIASLYRFLHARYSWSLDSLFDGQQSTEGDAEPHKRSHRQGTHKSDTRSGPKVFKSFVKTTSERYEDALVRELRHIREINETQRVASTKELLTHESLKGRPITLSL